MFELAFPWALLLLPLPWLIWYVAPSMPQYLPAALKIPFYQVVAGLVEREKHGVATQLQLIIWYFIWSLLVLAFAGPRWVGEPKPLEREGYNMMLALDVSGSMELNDMLLHGRPVTRLALVKRAAEQFVRDRAGDRIGLILFGSKAYLQTPLTYDHQSLLKRIDDASVGLAGKTTSIGDALGLAVKRLQQVPEAGRVVILLTDGVNNSGVLEPLKAADIAKTDGIKVYTIGLGSDPRRRGDLFLNLNSRLDLDEDTLKKMAVLTGGRYFRATDSQSLQAVYQTINKMEKVVSEQDAVRPQHDYYPWPLGLALIVFIGMLAYKGGLLTYSQELFLRRRGSDVG